MRCYTDRHNIVIAAKGSTLDRASDGRDGHGGFRHGVVCRSVAKPGAVAPFFWSGKAHGQKRNAQVQSCSIALWRSRSCPALRQPRPSSLRGRQHCFWCLADAVCCLSLEARGYRKGLVPGESMRRSSFCFRIRLAASVFDVGEVIVLGVK